MRFLIEPLNCMTWIWTLHRANNKSKKPYRRGQQEEPEKEEDSATEVQECTTEETTECTDEELDDMVNVPQKKPQNVQTRN